MFTGGEASDYTTVEPLIALKLSNDGAVGGQGLQRRPRPEEPADPRHPADHPAPLHPQGSQASPLPSLPRFNRVARMFGKLKQQRRIATLRQGPSFLRELSQSRRHTPTAEFFCQHSLGVTMSTFALATSEPLSISAYTDRQRCPPPTVPSRCFISPAKWQLSDEFLRFSA